MAISAHSPYPDDSLSNVHNEFAASKYSFRQEGSAGELAVCDGVSFLVQVKKHQLCSTELQFMLGPPKSNSVGDLSLRQVSKTFTDVFLFQLIQPTAGSL